MKDEKLDNFYNLELLNAMHSFTKIFLRYELRLRLCWRQNEPWAQSFKKCHQDRNSITNFCHELQVTKITVTVTCTFTIISSITLAVLFNKNEKTISDWPCLLANQ